MKSSDPVCFLLTGQLTYIISWTLPLKNVCDRNINCHLQVVKAWSEGSKWPAWTGKTKRQSNVHYLFQKILLISLYLTNNNKPRTYIQTLENTGEDKVLY